jgi:hypothetical protein
MPEIVRPGVYLSCYVQGISQQVLLVLLFLLILLLLITLHLHWFLRHHPLDRMRLAGAGARL